MIVFSKYLRNHHIFQDLLRLTTSPSLMSGGSKKLDILEDLALNPLDPRFRGDDGLRNNGLRDDGLRHKNNVVTI